MTTMYDLMEELDEENRLESDYNTVSGWVL